VYGVAVRIDAISVEAGPQNPQQSLQHEDHFLGTRQ
jgi:hypothetical protein